LTGISAATFPVIEEAKVLRPKLLLRKMQIESWHKDDCGLRVPLRIVEKEGKKKKKGKKK
jgi:hypothetical protein